jgi:hypothetical protein
METGLGNDLVSSSIRRSMELPIFVAQEPIVEEVGMVGFGITSARLFARYASDVLHDVLAWLWLFRLSRWSGDRDHDVGSFFGWTARLLEVYVRPSGVLVAGAVIKGAK